MRKLIRRLKPQGRLEWRKRRWWQTLVLQLFWPAMLVATVYVGLFFFLNSQPFVDVVEAQLNANMAGQFEIEDVSVGPFLNRIEIAGAQVDTPEGEHVIYAERLEVKVELFDLVGTLITRNQLNLADIQVYNADVHLDFQEYGSFNLLRALEPTTPPTEDTEPSDFTVSFENIDLYDSHCLLSFDGFAVDLFDVDITGYSLEVGQELKMSTVPSAVGDFGVDVDYGEVRFEPHLFSLPMAEYGHPAQGAALEATAGGRTSHVARLWEHSAAAMAQVGSNLAVEEGWEGEVPGVRDLRGNYVVAFENVNIDDFWWRDMTYGFRRFRAELVGGGTVALNQPSMNLAPTEEEVTTSAKENGHTPSDTPLDEMILFDASLDMILPGNHTALSWFIGPLIESEDPVQVVADMSGDLSHAEGSLGLVTDRLVASGQELRNVRLTGDLEGQRLNVYELTTTAFGGEVAANGFYTIIDGDFDLDVVLGVTDPDQNFQRVRGINLAGLFGEDLQRFTDGELTGALNLANDKGRMTVALAEPLVMDLADPLPYGGGDEIRLEQAALERDGSDEDISDETVPFLAWENRILRIEDDLTATMGRDTVRVDRNGTIFVDEGRFDDVTVAVNVDNAGQYLTPLGVKGVNTRRVVAELNADGQFGEPVFSGSATILGGSYQEMVQTETITVDARWIGTVESPDISAMITVEGGKYADTKITTASLDARYSRGQLNVTSLKGDTGLGSVSASGWIKPFRSQFGRLRKEIPLDMKVAVSNVDLSLIPQLGPYDAAGVVDANARISGTSLSPTASGQVRAQDLQAFNEYIPILETDFGYAKGQLSVSGFRAEYGEKRPMTDGTEQRAEVVLNVASINLDSLVFDVDGNVNRLHLKDLAPVQQAADLSGTINFRVEGRGDLHALIGGGAVSEPIIADGRLGVDELVLGKRYLGDVSVGFRHEGESVILDGTLFEELELDGDIVLSRPLDGKARLSFNNLNWLDQLPELAEAINGDVEAHKRAFLVEDAKLPLSELRTSGYLEIVFEEDNKLLAALHLDKFHAMTYGEVVRNAGPVDLLYRHNSGTVEIQHFEIETRRKRVKLWGQGGIDGTLDFQVNGELSATLASLFAGETIADPQGSLAISVDVTGDLLNDEGINPEGIELNGFVGIREPVRLRIRGQTDPLIVRSGVIRIASADECLFSGTTCYLIPAGTGLQGQFLGGTFNLRGEIVREGPVPTGGLVQGTASNMSFRLKNEATFTFDIPDVNLFVLDLADLESEPPVLSGSVVVTEGRYYKNYNFQTDLLEQRVLGQVLDRQRRSERYQKPIWEKIPELGLLQLDLNVSSGNGIRVDNEVAGAQVDLELIFDIRLQGTLAELAPTGIVDVRDGMVRFRSTEFEVLPGGQLTFTGDMNARLDLTAQAEISTQTSFAQTVVRGSDLEARRRINTTAFSEGSQIFVITLSLTGNLENPVYDLESQPVLNDTNIITLVLTGRTLDNLNADSEQNPAFDIALSSFIAPLFEAQVDELLAADQFKFTFAEGAAQFVYVNQVSREFSVAAGVSIRGSEGNEQAISAKYKFSDSWLLELSGQNTIEEEGKAPIPRVGARVRWRIPLD